MNNQKKNQNKKNDDYQIVKSVNIPKDMFTITKDDIKFACSRPKQYPNHKGKNKVTLDIFTPQGIEFSKEELKTLQTLCCANAVVIIEDRNNNE